MSIFIKEKIEKVSQKEFHLIDEEIMKYVFELHNDLGRFCDETIYHRELNFIANRKGFSAQNEVAICIRHKDFCKKYYIDLLVNNSCIYELKTVDNLSGIHQKQLINYLLLTDIAHGKLINFRTSSVEYEFVSTKLNAKDRMNYNLNTREFLTLNDQSSHIFEIIRSLVDAWGVFLELDLYNEAVIYFLGGKDKVISSIDILRNDRIIGQQKICLLDENVAFHLSALTKHFVSYETNIKRILKHTKLNAIQWINFNKREITFKTVKAE